MASKQHNYESQHIVSDPFLLYMYDNIREVEERENQAKHGRLLQNFKTRYISFWVGVPNRHDFLVLALLSASFHHNSSLWFTCRGRILAIIANTKPMTNRTTRLRRCQEETRLDSFSVSRFVELKIALPFSVSIS